MPTVNTLSPTNSATRAVRCSTKSTRRVVSVEGSGTSASATGWSSEPATSWSEKSFGRETASERPAKEAVDAVSTTTMMFRKAEGMAVGCARPSAGSGGFTAIGANSRNLHASFMMSADTVVGTGHEAR